MEGSRSWGGLRDRGRGALQNHMVNRVQEGTRALWAGLLVVTDGNKGKGTMRLVVTASRHS